MTTTEQEQLANETSGIPEKTVNMGPNETRIIHDPEAILSSIKGACESSVKSLAFCTDSENLIRGFELMIDSYKKALKNHQERNVESTFRWLVQIEASNDKKRRELIDSVKELQKLGIEVRHLDTPPFLKFALKDSKELYATFEAGQEGRIVVNVLFSNEKAYVAQFEAAFEEAWKKSIDATQRIREIEQGKEPIRTILLTDPSEILAQTTAAMDNTGAVYAFTNSDGLRMALRDLSEHYKSILKRSGKVRILLPLDNQRDVEFVKKSLDIGLEIKHVEQKPQPSFSVTDSKLFTTMDRMTSSDVVSHLLVTNDPLYIEQYKTIFEQKWNEGVDAITRIREIEKGIEGERTEIIKDVSRAAETARDCFAQCEKEILIILASQQVVTRNLALYQEMIDQTIKRKVKVRILLPAMDASVRKIFQNVEWRPIDRMNVGYAIYDGKKMLITQYGHSSDNSRAEESIQSNIFTTNREHISGIVSVFDALWRESELRHEAEKSRKRAELLQDILSHDMGNYNQLIRLSAEIIHEQVMDKELEPIIANMLSAIDGSTTLLEKAKKLGKVISEDNPELHQENLIVVLQQSLDLVKKANPKKRIVEKWAVSTKDQIFVKADDMLGEVFTNILGNAVRYTEANDVNINIEINESKIARIGQFWNVSISDKGGGIPEEIKKRMFGRYVENARGSGLGLSIVHALVVERYKGMIEVKDRVPGDHTKGTLVELYFPKA
jgi:signal transduction histidine kinase